MDSAGIRPCSMSNYDHMLEAARQRFLCYDTAQLASRAGIRALADSLCTTFFAQQVRIDCVTGQITLDGEAADFVQGLSVYDWLCDRRPGAAAANEFCPVGSLPGVFVGGSGLGIVPAKLAQKIHQNPDGFCRACEIMQGQPVSMGDLGYRIEIFPGLPMCLKFYFGDEEFPPSLTLLWDRNILHFVRYETVYYIAGCLQERLLQLM